MDRRGKWTGVPNLLKRVQARELFRILSPAEGEHILDFGCGAGFFAYEVARRGASVIAADIFTLPKSRTVNNGTLDFVTLKPGANLPFPDNRFHKILMSEVIIVLPDPLEVLRELYRVLKPGGRIILLNTLGRKQIQEAYENGHPLLRRFKKKYPDCPADYDGFCRFFLGTDYKDKQLRWYTQEEITAFLENAGFKAVSVSYPFKNLPFSVFSWKQFANLCKNNSIGVQFNLHGYLFLELLKWFSFKKDPSNIVLTGEKDV